MELTTLELFIRQPGNYINTSLLLQVNETQEDPRENSQTDTTKNVQDVVSLKQDTGNTDSCGPGQQRGHAENGNWPKVDKKIRQHRHSRRVSRRE